MDSGNVDSWATSFPKLCRWNRRCERRHGRLGLCRGVHYQGDAGIWTRFNFPIPTPVIQNNVRAKLVKGFVSFARIPASSSPMSTFGTEPEAG